MKISMQMIMKRYFFVLAVFILSACGPVGSYDVVHVANVKGNVYGDLAPEELDKISEFKRIAGETSESSVALPGQTKNYTPEQYLKEYPEMTRKGGYVYTVGGNDVLDIQLYDEANLTRQGVRVSGDGFITYPLIGRQYVEGLTTSQIEDLMARKLAEGQYILDAQVSVMVAEFASKKYKVLGAVKNPGIYPLKVEEQLLDAISNANGVDMEASGKRLMMIRTEEPAEGKTAQAEKIVINVELDSLLKGTDQISNLLLLDKDVVYIPKAEFFYVMGQVKNTGSYKFTDVDMTIVEAIGTAGGFTPIAARNQTRIVRVENGEEQIITVNVDAITDAGRKIQDVPIKPGDIIIVPESFF